MSAGPGKMKDGSEREPRSKLGRAKRPMPLSIPDGTSRSLRSDTQHSSPPPDRFVLDGAWSAFAYIVLYY